MLNLLGRKAGCHELREAFEASSSGIVLSPALAAHLSACADCRAAAEEFNASRALLKALPSGRHAPSPWFAARVMSALAAREAELRRSLDVWASVPRLAARLTWVSALALLLAGTWLYERPRPTPSGQTDESLFDSAPTPAARQADLPAIFSENDQ